MSKMSESKLKKILQKFETDPELAKLHEIHERIISAGGGSSQLQQTLQEAKPPLAGAAGQSTPPVNP
jgi:hypothetical protein